MAPRSRSAAARKAAASASPGPDRSAAEAAAAPTINWGAEEVDSDSEEAGWTKEDEGKKVWKPPPGYILTKEQVLFKRAIDRKFYIGTLVYAVASVAAAYACAPPPPPDDVLGAAAPSAAARLQLTAACALFTVYWILRSVIFDPPPEPKDDSWTFLQTCPAGRFIWLTINIDAAQLCYWTLALAMESEVLLSPTLPPNAATIAATLHWGLLSALHSGAVFVWSLSFMLMALFLKFCWFEPGWDRCAVGCGSQECFSPAFYQRISILPRHAKDNNCKEMVDDVLG